MVLAETQDAEPVWDKEIDIPEKLIQFVDDNVAASMLLWAPLPFLIGA